MTSANRFFCLRTAPVIIVAPSVHLCCTNLTKFDSERHLCTSVPVVMPHPCQWRAIPADRLLRSASFNKLACCTAFQPHQRRQTGCFSFRRQLLEQSSTTRDICTVACEFAIFSQRLRTFLLRISYPESSDLLTCTCRASNNFCYLAHTKIPMMMMLMIGYTPTVILPGKACRLRASSNCASTPATICHDHWR